MFCSASKENVIDFINVVNKAINSSTDKFDINNFIARVYNNVSKATNSHEKAVEYIRMVPSISMSLIASVNSGAKIKELIKNDGIDIANIAKLSVDFSDKESGWDKANSYVKNLAESKDNAIEIIASLPEEVVGVSNSVVAEDINPSVRESKILNAARKLTVLSTYDREVGDLATNEINQAAAPFFAIKRKILDLLPSAGYDSSNIKFQGIDGVFLKATSSKNIPTEQLRADQNVEDWVNNEGVVLLLVDREGNPIKVDSNGDVSDNGKYVYYKIRNTDNINIQSLSAQDKENISALSRAEGISEAEATAKYIDDINELADIRKDALMGGEYAEAVSEQQSQAQESQSAGQKGDLSIGKIPNTNYEVKADGVYFEGKKLDNPKNLSHKELITEDIGRRQEEELNNVGIKQKERAFSQLRDEKDENGKVTKVRTPEEKLNAINLIERNVAEGAVLTKEEQREVQKTKDELASQGYEVPEILGRNFHQGMKVIVTSSIPDESLAEGEEIITKVLTPQINKDDKMVQTAQIEVTVGTKKGGLTREQWLEEQKKKETRTDKINAKYNEELDALNNQTASKQQSQKLTQKKGVMLVINGGSVGWVNNDHTNRTKISSVTNLGNTPILKYDKDAPERGVFSGMAYFKIGGMYGQAVPIERPRIYNESEYKDLLINILTGDLVNDKGSPISSEERIRLASPFLMLSEKTKEDVESKNRIFMKGNTLVVGLYSFDISKPSNRALAREELTKFLAEVRPERRLRESELQKHHKVLGKGEAPYINSVSPVVNNKGGAVLAENEKTGKLEQVYNVYDVAKMHVNFNLVDESFDMPILRDLGNGRFQVSTEKQDYNSFIKNNYFINLKLTSDNKAQLTGAYLTFKRANVSTSENNTINSEEIDSAEIELLNMSNSSNVHEAIISNVGNYVISESEIKSLTEDTNGNISPTGLSISDVAKSIKHKNKLKESLAEIEDFIRDYLINGEKEYSLDYKVQRPSVLKRKILKLRKEYAKIHGTEYVSKLDKAINFDEYIKSTDAQFSNSFQKVKGTLATSTDVNNAKKWWESSPLSKFIALNEAFNIANTIDENNIASFEDYTITLYKGSDSTEIYHEAWHAFTSKFLSDTERFELYKEASKLKGSFIDNKGIKVSFSSATNAQLEEYLAEKFRDYMISNNRKGLSNKIKAIFDKIVKFLKGAFNGYSTQSATSNPYIREMYEKLRVGNIRNNTFEISGALTGVQLTDVNNRINGYLFDYISSNNNGSTFSYSENPINEDALEYVKNSIEIDLAQSVSKLKNTGDSNVAKEANFLSYVLNNWDDVSSNALNLNKPVSEGIDPTVNNLIHITASKTGIYNLMEGIREAFDNKSSVAEVEVALNSNSYTRVLLQLIGNSNTNAPLEANLFNKFINSFNGSGVGGNQVVLTKGFTSFANGELIKLGKSFTTDITTTKNESNLISPEYYRLLAIGAGVWSSSLEAKYRNQDYTFDPISLAISGQGFSEYQISSNVDTFTTIDGMDVNVGDIFVENSNKLNGDFKKITNTKSEVPINIEEGGYYKGYKLSNKAESLGENELSFSESDVFSEYVNGDFGIASNTLFRDYNEYKSYKIESIIAEKSFVKDFRYSMLLAEARENLDRQKNESDEAFERRINEHARKLWVRDVALQRSNNQYYLTNSATALLEPLLNKHPHLRDNTFIKSLSLENGGNIKHSELSVAEFNEIANSFRYLTRKESIKASDVSENNLISEYFNSLVNVSKLKGGNLSSISDAENISKNNIIDPLISKLKESNLAKDVKVLSNDGIVSALENLGVSKDVAKQVAVWHGSPHSFERLLTKGLIQEVEC